ncbi:MAG: hypothetical protein JXR32_07980 [Anaerolineaceae bacterium]|nr:hypothetical protein [Anaerolineaceae bacterium]
MSIRLLVRNILIMAVSALLLGPGMVFPQNIEEKARGYTRYAEFDYLDWTLRAIWEKTEQSNYPNFPADQQVTLVRAYVNLVREVQTLENQIAFIFADPSIQDPIESSMELSAALDEKQSELDNLTPVIETILQEQVGWVLQGEGLSTLSMILPPILYRTSDPPLSLFISPRERIELVVNTSLQPGMSSAEIVTLEERVERDLNVSALIEPVGGLGTYPTMIMLTSDLNWLIETVAHEWIHNYLTLHPLGLNYDTTPELRTMNETTANLAGKEIGTMVIQTYYPDLQPPDQGDKIIETANGPEPGAFIFQKEMRNTRVEVDRLLALGKIDAAEEYMEARRLLFWENGYLIRRINQAYFAFYGAYNDSPGGGAAGEDPVGPAVVAFREKCGSLGVFLRTIAGMASVNELEDALINGCN